MITFHIDGLIYGLQPHGGISRVFTNLINALERRNDCRVKLYLPTELKTRVTLPNHDQSVVYPSPRILRPGRLFCKLNESRASRAAARMWSSAREGVFLSSHYSTHADICIPQIQVMQDLIYEKFPELFATAKDRAHVNEKRNSIDAADGIIAPSKWSMLDCRGTYNLQQKATRIIPYAIDDRFRFKATQSAVEGFVAHHTDNEPFILHTGSRYLHKNFSALMAAFSRWDKRRKYRLVNVGGGPIQPHEAAIAKGLGIADRLSIVPGLSDDDLVVAYHAASAFVFPSMYEGFGLPVIEAIACGVPSAVSNASCLPEVGGDTPWYFNPYDSNQMLDALDQAVSATKVSPRLSEGISRTLGWNWDQVADQFYAVASEVEAACSCSG